MKHLRHSFPTRGTAAVLATSLATSLATWLAACAPHESAPPPRPAVFVSTVHNDAGQAERVLSATIRPRIESDLAFRIGGKVTARLVEIGQAVRAGQPLVRIDADDTRIAAAAAAEQLRAAEVDAAQAASDAARFARLLADGSVGAADRERQQARADAAAARAALARQQLELARNRLGYTTLTAPFDGTVTALRVEAGQQVSDGQTVATLAQPGALEVQADIPEALAPQLRCYRASLRRVDNEPALPLRLRELAPSASALTRTFRARYAFAAPPPAGALQMGMTAELRLVRVGTSPSAALPAGALLATDGRASVWLVDERSGALTRTPVQLLAQTTDGVRVAGLADGALVVTAGAHKLDAKLQVQPVRRPLEALAREEDRR
jgi:RND family efflux transporter MFP subunit